jgi:hypothetical protein
MDPSASLTAPSFHYDKSFPRENESLVFPISHSKEKYSNLFINGMDLLLDLSNLVTSKLARGFQALQGLDVALELGFQIFYLSHLFFLRRGYDFRMEVVV